MTDESTTPADEKTLALYYAYAALVKTLKESGHLDMDHLFAHLAGATQQLQKIEEHGAANYLGAICESLTGI